MKQGMVGIVAALTEEVRPLRARLMGARRLPVAAPLAVTGLLAGHPVALVVTGDGAQNARAGVRALFDAAGVEWLLVVGVAGALTSDLLPGALVIAERVRDEANDYRADEALVHTAVHRTAGRPATVITADRIADTPADRARLLSAHADAAGPAVVDLESSLFVGAAQERGVSWVVVRAISDTADQHLPALLNEARDDGGAVRRTQVVRGLLLEPRALPTLLSLRWRIGRCAQVLATAAERLVGAETGRGAAA